MDIDSSYGYVVIRRNLNTFVEDINTIAKENAISNEAAIYLFDRLYEVAKLCDEYEEAYNDKSDNADIVLGYDRIKTKFETMLVDISDMLKSGDIKSEPAEYLQESFQRVANACTGYRNFYYEEQDSRRAAQDSDSKRL